MPFEQAKDANGTLSHESPGKASKEPSEDGEINKSEHVTTAGAPPLPDEPAPPLPDEAPPVEGDNDDGWDAIWDETAQAFYFYNRISQVSQWTNPRVPDPTREPAPPGVGNYDRMGGAQTGLSAPPGTAGDGENKLAYTGYNPAIHGDYDPTADYARPAPEPVEHDATGNGGVANPENMYDATGTFNRFTGKWQAAHLNPEMHNDENKSRRQMSAYFDVDRAANSHDGRSLKAERAGKKLTKQELKAFKEKRKSKKEEKRKAWLRD